MSLRGGVKTLDSDRPASLPCRCGVVTISITAKALAAIEARLPEGREADRRP
jgi:hypothetical protein